MALFSVGEESLSLNGQPVEAHVIDFSNPASPRRGGRRGRFVVVSGDDTLGCAARDYNGVNIAGAVVLVDRGVFKSLDVEALKDIALYLNFDMMASPNTCTSPPMPTSPYRRTPRPTTTN